MRQGRRFILGFLLIVTLALCSLSNIPLTCADDAVDEASGGASAEAVVDAAGDVEVEEPSAEDDAAAEPEATKEEAAPEPVEEEVAETVEKAQSILSGAVDSAKSKATALVDKVKSITPQQTKKVAAGAIGIWGVVSCSFFYVVGKILAMHSDL